VETYYYSPIDEAYISRYLAIYMPALSTAAFGYIFMAKHKLQALIRGHQLIKGSV